MQAGQPGTTTPLPPCAIDGGWSTKQLKLCRRISCCSARSKTDFCMILSRVKRKRVVRIAQLVDFQHAAVNMEVLAIRDGDFDSILFERRTRPTGLFPEAGKHQNIVFRVSDPPPSHRHGR